MKYGIFIIIHNFVFGWKNNFFNNKYKSLVNLAKETISEYLKQNMGYFLQEMKIDAYTFAVMKYKYDEVKYLYLPEVYHNDDFDKIVYEW